MADATESYHGPGAAVWLFEPEVDPHTAPETLHRRLAHFNEKRLLPALGSADWRADLGEVFEMKLLRARARG